MRESSKGRPLFDKEGRRSDEALAIYRPSKSIVCGFHPTSSSHVSCKATEYFIKRNSDKTNLSFEALDLQRRSTLATVFDIKYV